MVGRIIEIATDGVHLSVDRGFMQVRQDREELGRVALDDIDALIVHGHGATWSANLTMRLAERKAPIVLCGSNHAPIALVWPLDGHYEQGRRMEFQAAASRSLSKRLWKELVRAKITAQAFALGSVGQNPAPLLDFAKRVRSGDPDNIEAQAARRYWSVMMGEDFRRDRDRADANAFLNYGYMVLRAATARSILAAGLHPSLAIHHKSKGSALRLSDDLMEPFRPMIDILVHAMVEEGKETLDAETKRRLAAITTLDMEGPKGASPLQNCLDRLAGSLAQIYLGERQSLELPGPPLLLAVAGTTQ